MVGASLISPARIIPSKSAIRDSALTEALLFDCRLGPPPLEVSREKDVETDTEAFQREVPRAQTVVLERCGHMALLERPQVFNSQLLAFAQALPAASPTTP